MREATIQGKRLRLLESWAAPGLVLDRWEDPAEPEGSWERIGVVVLATDGATHLDDPNMPSDEWVMGWNPHPSADPVERFLEAIRQARQRAAERLGGPMVVEQVWPPAGTRTLTAFVVHEDTRPGWVRVDWLPDGQVAVQGIPEDLRAQVPESELEADVVAWAQNSGLFVTVNPPGS